jgi:hypothetical protein
MPSRRLARLLTPRGVPDVAAPVVTRLRRKLLERWIEEAIALLDALDGDADIEPEASDFNTTEPFVRTVRVKRAARASEVRGNPAASKAGRSEAATSPSALTTTAT